ncbi:class I SAM-dependent methyltransferase [Alkalicella caledoniensis]|uniref:Class I SAM-dependent methyltransferase n=1 Tax=Alkalicella caledoniensis TaxID=2731377 RepID=A0A7G9WBJ1_ALKCA|nr:class I SAM-dependent methyltransferase [Alkalicella caledoniensis]QNO16053.1 class I SAM-dependent methyltransferase [Alkalicella caledoniensis]
MKFTGERVVPKVMNPENGMLIEHIARYEFAKAFCKGRVLDIACGVGYGTDYLLEGNENIDELVGVDIDHRSIEYAIEHYSYPNTKYFIDDCLSDELPEKYGTFDTIVSFETIEHFHGDEKFVQNLYNLLKDDGTLVISTPFGRGKNQPCSCPFHVYQYTEEEFWEILKPFKNITMYHQIDQRIEIPNPDTKYYLMVAVCKKGAND